MINHEDIFYDVDDFIKQNEQILLPKLKTKNIKNAGRKPRLHLSEIVTIIIVFHHSRMRTFKDYYNMIVIPDLKKDFPGLVSYNRFIELMKNSAAALYLFLICKRLGVKTGRYFIDSTKLIACNNNANSIIKKLLKTLFNSMYTYMCNEVFRRPCGGRGPGLFHL